MTHLLVLRGSVYAGTNVVVDVVVVVCAMGAEGAVGTGTSGYTIGAVVCLSTGIGSIAGVSTERSVSAKSAKIMIVSILLFAHFC